MSPTAAGTFRLAAARGEIGKLELLSRVPRFDIEASVLGFTALHAAAVQGQAGACSLKFTRVKVLLNLVILSDFSCFELLLYHGIVPTKSPAQLRVHFCPFRRLRLDLLRQGANALSLAELCSTPSYSR